MHRFSANLSIMFTEVPFIERFALAAKHGFKAVECWFPYEHSKDELAVQLKNNGLKLIGMNSAPGNTTKGDWGLAVDPARRDAFLASIDQAIDYASTLDCGSIHVMAGMMPEGRSEADGKALYIENIGIAADRAKRAGKTVLIEPLNPIDRPGYFLSRQSQAASIIEILKRDNVKIMYDLYHAQMTEGNLVATLKKNIAKIGHIQIADVPGRNEPGTGEINFAFVMQAITDIGYAGWIGCEYKPKTETVAGLSWRNAYLSGKT
jgi:hydroxypyruvate isomerase